MNLCILINASSVILNHCNTRKKNPENHFKTAVFCENWHEFRFSRRTALGDDAPDRAAETAKRGQKTVFRSAAECVATRWIFAWETHFIKKLSFPGKLIFSADFRENCALLLKNVKKSAKISYFFLTMTSKYAKMYLLQCCVSMHNGLSV